MLLKDAARHSSETCGYRQVRCAHCPKTVEARALTEHEGGCSAEQIECPNAGCGVAVARWTIGYHRGVCGREEVECPCPGCVERMARVEVKQHVSASGVVHMQRALGHVAEHADHAAGLEARVVGFERKVAEQGRVITALRKAFNCEPKTIAGGGAIKFHSQTPENAHACDR